MISRQTHANALAFLQIDFIKMRIQTSTQYSSLTDGITKVIQQEGFFTLYTGLTSEIVKGCMQNSIYFACYDVLKDSTTELLIKHRAKHHKRSASDAESQDALLINSPLSPYMTPEQIAALQLQVEHLHEAQSPLAQCYYQTSASNRDLYSLYRTHKHRSKSDLSPTSELPDANALNARSSSSSVAPTSATHQKRSHPSHDARDSLIVPAPAMRVPIAQHRVKKQIASIEHDKTMIAADPASTPQHDSASANESPLSPSAAAIELQTMSVSGSNSSPVASSTAPHALHSSATIVELPVYLHLMIGMCAGCITQCFVNPMSVIQTRIMAHQKALMRLALQAAESGMKAGQPMKIAVVRTPGIVETGRSIYQQEGLSTFFAGLLPSFILTSNPAIQFLVFDRLKSLLLGILARRQTPRYVISALESFVIGAVAKIIATIITYPYIMAKVRLQFKDPLDATRPQYTGTMHVIRSILQSQGLLGLYTGLRAQMLKSVLGAALMFMMKEKAHEASQKLYAMMQQQISIRQEARRKLETSQQNDTQQQQHSKLA